MSVEDKPEHLGVVETSLSEHPKSLSTVSHLLGVSAVHFIYSVTFRAKLLLNRVDRVLVGQSWPSG